MYDENEDDCESLLETIDVIEDDENMLSEADYEDKNIRDSLIELGIMGDA
jgi:hypothetical protein